MSSLPTGGFGIPCRGKDRVSRPVVPCLLPSNPGNSGEAGSTLMDGSIGPKFKTCHIATMQVAE